MFLLIFCYQQQVQNILIMLLWYVNRIKLLVLIAENINIDNIDISPLQFAMIFYTNRELNTIII